MVMANCRLQAANSSGNCIPHLESKIDGVGSCSQLKFGAHCNRSHFLSNDCRMPTIPVLAFLTLRLPSGHVGFGFKRWSLLAVSPIFIIIFASVLHLMRCSRGHHCVCTLFTAIVMICCRHTEIFVWLCHMNFKFKARSVGISLDTSGPELCRRLAIIRTRTLGFRFVSKESSIWRPQSAHNMCEIDTTDATRTNGNASNFTLHLANDQKRDGRWFCTRTSSWWSPLLKKKCM